MSEKTTVSAADVESFFEDVNRLIEPALRDSLRSACAGSDLLRRSMAYTLFAPAKRFRPSLALAAFRAVNVASPQRALPLMVAIELLHTYSLIHDDLPCMDDDQLRRGQPTCHRVFGEGMAVLAGDALQALAFQVMVEAARSAGEDGRREIAALDEVVRAAGPGGMVAGQALDLLAAGGEVSAQEVEEIHRLKTGRLIRAAVSGGARLGGASDEECERMDRFGECLGLAFQMVDDLLNEDGDSRKTGKGVGTDRDHDKATLPSVIGAKGTRRRALSLRDECRRILEPFGARAALLAALADYTVERER
jgi:geranylgeranyl pyrophosphate synthase